MCLGLGDVSETYETRIVGLVSNPTPFTVPFLYRSRRFINFCVQFRYTYSTAF